MLLNGKEKCNCKKTSCARHGNCEACVAYHKDRKLPPYCKREKNFIRKLFI